MANEVHYNHTTGSTLYFCTFQLDGDVFLSNGESDETWGTGSRDADDYDMAMAEDGSGGHFVGSFDTSIAAGIYHVTVYLQAGANPADTDKPLGQGVMYWNGSAEINIYTLDTSINDDIIGADGDTLETLSDQLDNVAAEESKVLNVYGPGE